MFPQLRDCLEAAVALVEDRAAFQSLLNAVASSSQSVPGTIEVQRVTGKTVNIQDEALLSGSAR